MRTSALAGTILLLAATAARADEEALRAHIERLEARIRVLEERESRAADPAGSGSPSRGGGWTRNVRIGGSGNSGYYGGEKNSGLDPDSFLVWDARLFVDANLGEDISVGEHTIFRNAGASFEWDIVRLGAIQNRVGDLYVDFQGFLGREGLNFQVGRFQIPVGEAYLRYGQGYAYKPFVSNTVGGPWWWDEGVRFYGSSGGEELGYVSSISDGDTAFNTESGSGKQFTLKLFWRPVSWLYLSASGLRSGQIGSPTSPASGALWLGEAWARAFGSGTGVPNYQEGAVVADGPNEIEDTWLAAADVILELDDKLRVWLAYGHYAIEARGSSAYDRDLEYWIAEAVLRGSWLSETLRPFYLGLRANALGTYDGGRGYLLDVARAGALGYNMRSLTAYSAVLGWELTPDLRLRAEYTRRDIDLVGGVTAAMQQAARGADSFAVEVGAAF